VRDATFDESVLSGAAVILAIEFVAEARQL
jgi:hypothetical protein